jgi:hypothetical protein
MAMARKADQQLPTNSQAATFDLVSPMVASAHKEMSELSKKKQDGVLNELKVRHINRLLGKVSEALGDDPSVEFLEMLDEESLPQNSDAVLILGQWQAAMNQFQQRYYGYSNVDHMNRWFTKEDPGTPA